MDRLSVDGFYLPPYDSALTYLNKLSEVAHFNFYRFLYPHLTFKEKQTLYQRWYKQYPEFVAERADIAFALECFSFEIEHVVELGGGTCKLADLVIRMFNQIQWVSYDIIKHKLVSSYVHEHILSQNLWETDLVIKPVDLFISTHTIEHFSNEEVYELLMYLLHEEPKYILLQSPIEPAGQTWMNYHGAHIYTHGSNRIKMRLSDKYELLKEKPRNKTKREGWCGFWRYKHGSSNES